MNRFCQTPTDAASHVRAGLPNAVTSHWMKFSLERMISSERGEPMAKRAKGEGSLLKIRTAPDPVTGKRTESRFWYAQYFQNGRQIRVSTKEETKAQALVVLRKLMGDSDRGLAPITDARKLSYAELRAGHLASYVERGNKSLLTTPSGEETTVGLPQLDEFFGFSPEKAGPSAATISTNTAREFVRKRQGDGAGNAPINRSLPPSHVEYRPRRREDSVRPEDSPAEGTACAERLPRTRKVWRTGRAPSVASLAIHHLPFVPRHGRLFDITNLRVEWERACDACGLGKRTKMDPKTEDGFAWYKYEGLLVDDLRRSAVRNLVTLAGVPERIAMKITGHKTRDVFDCYHIVSASDVTDAMRRVELIGKTGTVSETSVKGPSRSVRRLTASSAK
jgi:hypothetical protein